MPKSTYLFYDVMQYPIPFQKEFFAYEEAVNTISAPEDIGFSRAKPCEGMQEYLDTIETLGWLWRSLPFVEAIYLSNSISFNALHENSDIDLFVVASPGRLRLARACMFTSLFMFRLIKNKKRSRKRFCLDFFVTRDAMDLQRIKHTPIDPYLVYWLAHLVPLYKRLEDASLDIYEANYWLRDYLPTFPMEHVIHLGNDLFAGSTKMKQGIEKILGGVIGNVFEYSIKALTIPFFLIKKKRAGPSGEQCILADTMIKFHQDKRKSYAMRWKIAGKKST